ncbi:spore photoproduct lyase [Abyssisolibacter fermentans]|uniref:spore photoproduct lyase n=1 Tax=Abyssisolibacter fermentans TaxID=1766203 RepID=UPI0008315ED4|nr:spore photoproduct lyase [Abyssisolibacter fermentans]
MIYKPKRIFIEEKALNYEMGKRLYDFFSKEKTDVKILKNNKVTGIPGKTPAESFVEGKNSIAIRVRKKGEFQTCKPSAHYQLPLFSGCAGKCEYCYLNTRFGNKPYNTIYANVDEILETAKGYIKERGNEVTLFEAAATSDPIPLDYYSKSLKKAIEFFANEEHGRLRFVTKFPQIEDYLEIDHKGHTTIRFSLNTQDVIKKYEHATSSAEERIKASKKIITAGYHMGFIIGPVILYENWKEAYLKLLKDTKEELGKFSDNTIHFEVISHRFTASAKKQILKVFPTTSLPMDEEDRKFKYGQFGYGKYVYPKEQLNEMKEFFQENILSLFSGAEIDYII